MFGSVIIKRRIVARHIYRDGLLVDRHITVNDFANRYVIVGALNIEAGRRQTHIRSSGFRPLRFRRHTVLQCDLYAVRQFVFISKRCRIAYCAMFGSVIIKRRIVARHIYCDGLLRDLQRSRIRRRNDILSCSVNRALGSVREDSVICSDIRSRRANGDISEISIHRRTGKAGNALLRSIISLRVAVRRQRDVLIIVEIDLVRSRPNRDRLLVIRYWRVAIDRNGGFRHSLAERRSIIFRICNFSRCSVQIIVYRVSGSVLFIVERQRIRLFFKRDCLRLGMTIHRQEGIGIFIILPGSRGCNVLIRFLPHIARLVIRTDHFFSIIIDILYRINGRNLSNINLSVHVPC